MSTVSGQRLRRRLREPRTEGVLTPNPWPLRLAALVVLGLVVLALAPTVVVNTPLWNSALARATADVRGQVVCRTASLGWFSPLKLYDLEVRDLQGEVVLRAPEVRGQKGLLGLIGGGPLGKFHVARPVVTIVVTREGSNIEDVLANYLNSEEPASTAAQIEVDAAQVEILDQVSGERFQLADVDLAGDFPGASAAALAISGRGRVLAGAGAAPADTQFKLVWPTSTDAALQGELNVATRGLPLALLETVLRRTDYLNQCAGLLDADIECRWTNATDNPKRRMVAQIEAQNVLASGGWLGTDQLRLASIKAPATITWEGNRLEVEELGVECDLGRMAYHGLIDTSAGLWQSLSRQSYELKGQLDLAALAAQLPHTIHVREGTKITEGRARLFVKSQPSDQGQEFDGKLETTNLVAMADGRQLTWEQPVLVTFKGRDAEQGLVLDHLRCTASFLELEAAGTPDSLSLSSSYDLSRLAQELGQFLELGDLRLAGDGWSHCTWKQDRDGRFALDGEFQVREFAWIPPGARPWTEDNLLVFLETTGQVRDRQCELLDKAVVTVRSGPDECTVRAQETVRNPSGDSLWPVAIELRGELARWLPRLEPWLGTYPDVQLGGQCQLAARARYDQGSLDVSESTGRIEQFRWHSPSWFIDEPSVQTTAVGRWNGKRSALELDRASWRSPALSVDAADLRLTWPETGDATLTGSLAYVGDLRRLNAWTHDPQVASDWDLSGRIGGEGSIRRTGQVTTAKFDSQIDQLVAAGAAGEPWREPQVRLAVHAEIDHRAQTLALDRCEIEADALRCRARGQVSQLDRQRNLELTGQIDYDADRLRSLIERCVGTGVTLSGHKSQAFALRGPLRGADANLGQLHSGPVSPADEPAWWARLDGDGGLGWDAAEIHGLRLGSGQLRGRLHQGVIQVDPLSLLVSEGRVNLGGLVRLSPGPAELQLSPGTVVDHVRLTPEMCAQGLQYVAPVLAGATQVQGQFSIQLDGCRVPLSDPRQADVGGRLQVHNVEVGPGPLMQELAVLFNRPEPAVLQQQSDVQFRLVNGRIYHRDLVLVFPELTIRTYGSVGLDQSLALMAEMPVPPKWIGNNKLGDALKSQTVRLPIAGTLNQPRLDRQAMQQAMAQLVGNTAGQALFNELNRGLDRLLKPR